MKSLTLAVAAIAVAFAFQLPLTALAAYCGASADTDAIEALAIAREPNDRTRIIDIDVVGNYARVDTQWKGRLTEYYVKDCGRWRYAGAAVPADAPDAVADAASRVRAVRQRWYEVQEPSLRFAPQRAITQPAAA